jgi:hypothetical protein
VALQRGHLLPAVPEISNLRSLARADLSALLEKRPQKTLASLRDTHHRVARAVAAGLPNVEVAQACGYSINRIAMLKKDPAFQDLVAHYRALVTAEFIRSVDNYMEVATANMLKAEVMISDKIDEALEKNETLPMRDLIAIAGDRADRFGYGKTRQQLNVNVDFAAQLEAARRRSAQAKTVAPPLAPRPAPATSEPPALSLGPTSFRRL